MTHEKSDYTDITYKDFVKNSDLKERYKNAIGFERNIVIREAYRENIEYIKRCFALNRGWFNPYFLDWEFTPIEVFVFNYIRAIGGIVLYPQVPVTNYFIDFGNPILKIGLECDGKQHERSKDILRDKALQKEGWTIYHVTGKECFDSVSGKIKPLDQIEGAYNLIPDHGSSYDTDLCDFFYNSAWGVIEAIKNIHFGYSDILITRFGMESLSLSGNTLLKHKII